MYICSIMWCSCSFAASKSYQMKESTITTHHHDTQMLSEPAYDVIDGGLRSHDGVKLTSNPAYGTTVKMEHNPAYSLSGNEIMESDYM